MNNSKGIWIFLSYELSVTTPVYGSMESLRIKPLKNIKKGDPCNTSHWSFPNHLGTHIDFPRHFLEDGSTVDDYPPNFWIFNSTFLADISPVEPGYIITPKIFDFNCFPDDSDLIFIKTGFCSQRRKDVYWKNNPVFSPDLAIELRERFPRLRVVGFDSISLSSFAHRELGRASHKAFLNHEQPILLLEDMDLSDVDEDTMLQHVIVSPLRIGGADAAPCTVFAEISQ